MNAIVSFWNAEEGWGELILANGSKCFAHFSAIQQSGGYRSLQAGDAVEVVWRTTSQDGYSCVADAIWPL
jgi:cold shock CspA family protein